MAYVLVVDDDQSLREFLEVLLVNAGHRVAVVSDVPHAETMLQKEPVDVVVTDFRIGTRSGLEVIRAAKGGLAKPEVIVITAYATPASAVEAMRQGAYDYIGKPFDNAELLLLVERAYEKRSLAEENRRLKETIATGGRNVFIGNSPAMAQVWAIVDKVAPTRSTVLIAGESGVGKEVVARMIHSRSPRTLAPFVALNCAAIPETLLESEIFGHVKGAFTGANTDRPGIMVAAGDGTVLLDEIGEMPLGMQAKLLRVLQERTVKPVGSTREVPFQARLLAATNKKLEDEVKAGRFREDLLFRLNVITVEVPPLRQRREDIGPLSKYFLSKVADELGRPRLHFAPETEKILEHYRFDGNLRQLQNAVERAATLSDTDEIFPGSLPAAMRGEPTAPAEVEATLTPNFSLETHLDHIERVHLVTALRAAGGVKMKAAELLGMSFRAFRYRLAKHGLGEREET